jgi:hypothetical protein
MPSDKNPCLLTIRGTFCTYSKGSTRRCVARLVLRHNWRHWQRIVFKRYMYPTWRGAACDSASEARWIAAEADFSRSSKGLGAGSWRLRVAGEQHDYTTRYSTSRADVLAEQVTSRHSTSRAPSSWALIEDTRTPGGSTQENPRGRRCTEVSETVAVGW